MKRSDKKAKKKGKNKTSNRQRYVTTLTITGVVFQFIHYTFVTNFSHIRFACASQPATQSARPIPVRSFFRSASACIYSSPNALHSHTHSAHLRAFLPFYGNHNFYLSHSDFSLSGWKDWPNSNADKQKKKTKTYWDRIQICIITGWIYILRLSTRILRWPILFSMWINRTRCATQGVPVDLFVSIILSYKQIIFKNTTQTIESLVFVLSIYDCRICWDVQLDQGLSKWHAQTHRKNLSQINCIVIFLVTHFLIAKFCDFFINMAPNKYHNVMSRTWWVCIAQFLFSTSVPRCGCFILRTFYSAFKQITEKINWIPSKANGSWADQTTITLLDCFISTPLLVFMLKSEVS